jgi:DNA-binding MarR family transcriptional regulator
MEPHEDLGIRLGLAYAAFVDRLNVALARSGFDDLGPAYGYVFRSLAAGPRTLSELATGLHMTTQGAAKIITEMEARGYVRRTAHPTDARARLIELTERGRAALRAARRVHRRLERELADQIGAQDVAGLRRGLDALLALADVDPSSRLLRPL